MKKIVRQTVAGAMCMSMILTPTGSIALAKDPIIVTKKTDNLEKVVEETIVNENVLYVSYDTAVKKR